VHRRRARNAPAGPAPLFFDFSSADRKLVCLWMPGYRGQCVQMTHWIARLKSCLSNGSGYFVSIGVLCALLSAVGCTQTIGRELQYQPIPQPRQASNPAAPPVTVKVFDRRPTEAIARNDSPALKTEYVPQNQVWNVLRSALEVELKNRGFRNGSGGNTVTVIVTFFWANVGESEEVVASIGLKVTVRRSDRSLAYSRSIEGQSKPWIAQHPSTDSVLNRHPTTRAAQAAMQDAVAKLVGDAAFISALNATQPSPQKAPTTQSTSGIS